MRKRKKPIEIDLSVIGELANGDPIEVTGLVAMFNRHMADGIEEMRTAIGSRQFARAAQIARNCIGLGEVLGITALVPTLRKLEQASKRAQPSGIARWLTRWEREFGEVREALEARLKQDS